MQLAFKEILSYITSRQKVIVDAWQQRCGHNSMNDLQRDDLLKGLLEHLSGTPVPLASILQRIIPVEKRDADALQSFVQSLHYLQGVFSYELEQYQSTVIPGEPDLRWMFNQKITQVLNEWTRESLRLWPVRIPGLNEAQTEVLRSFIHDTRGNLGAITGAATLLTIPNSDEAQRNIFAGILNRNVKDIQFVLNELLEISDLSREKGISTSVNVAQVFQEVIDETQTIPSNHQIQIQGPAQLMVETDRDKLRNLMQRLLRVIMEQIPKGFITLSYDLSPEEKTWFVTFQYSESGFPDLKQPREYLLKKALADVSLKSMSARQGLNWYLIRQVGLLLKVSLFVEANQWIYVKFPERLSD